MKGKKVTSDTLVAANRKNAIKSTGPKTPRGKSYSRRNALKHGFYSRELLVSEADRPQFAELRRQLETQYRPATPMQWIAFEGVATCSWRCKLAIRLEHRQFASRFEDGDQGQTGNAQTGNAQTVPDPHLTRWYGSSRLEIRRGIKDLEYASAEFNNSGYLHDETKESLSRGFGPEFVDTLQHWTPMSRDAILMADMLAGHRAKYGELSTDHKLDHALDQLPKIVQDPMQASQMVVKLIDERRHFLEELLKIMDHNPLVEGRDARERSDFNPGFLPAALAELRRAADWFLHLREVGL